MELNRQSRLLSALTTVSPGKPMLFYDISEEDGTKVGALKQLFGDEGIACCETNCICKRVF